VWGGGVCGGSVRTSGCSFDSPTQLAQLLRVGVERERERERGVLLCEFCVKENRKKHRALFSLDSPVEGNEQADAKEDKEQPCHWALPRFNVPQVLPSFSTSITRISLSLSTLISVQLHSWQNSGEFSLTVSIHFHSCYCVYTFICEYMCFFVCVWRNLRVYVWQYTFLWFLSKAN